MKRRLNKQLIGIFLILGIIAFGSIIAQIIWNHYVADNKNVCVMYFEETLQGLSEGSPVLLQGVEVGKVSDIKLSASENQMKFRIPVFIRFDNLSIINADSGGDQVVASNEEFLKNLINKGLKARLVIRSYLTGQLMIELVMLPQVNANLIDDGQKYLQIPTVLSKSGVLEKGLDSIKVQDMIERISKVWAIFEKELPVLLPKLTNSAINLNKTLYQLAVKGGNTIDNLNKTMQDVSDASRSLQNLTDYLERHPESLLAGKK